MEEEVQKITHDVELTFSDFLTHEIFSFGKYTLSVDELLMAIFVIAVGIFASNMIKKLIYRSEKIDIAKQFALSQISHYIIVFITTLVALGVLGITGSSLLLSSSALLVGIGLGLQNLFLDFVSGIIILLDQSVKVGDVIEIEGIIGKVKEVKMRTTTLKTRDNKSMIFPNAKLTKDSVINFSHIDKLVRFQIDVGVRYDEDVELVEEIMLKVAKDNIEVDKKREPYVWLEDFGHSALKMSLYYYSKSLFTAPRLKNDLRKAVLKNFRENGIAIPYPIQTLELKRESDKEYHLLKKTTRPE